MFRLLLPMTSGFHFRTAFRFAMAFAFADSALDISFSPPSVILCHFMLLYLTPCFRLLLLIPCRPPLFRPYFAAIMP